MATDGPIDRHRLQVLRQIGTKDPLRLERLVEAFEAEAPTSLASLSRAVAGQDAAGLCQGAHQLRVAAASLGATGVATLCADLEELAAAAPLGETAELLSCLRTELDRAVTALRVALARQIG